jgi:translation initiation factor 5A
MSWEQAEVRELREGRYVNVDEEPCKILTITMSKPGKHGEAKARLDVVGLFDGQKRSIVHPVTHKVKVPIIDKRSAQIVAIAGQEIMLMDLETYEQFSLPMDPELEGQLEPGKEVLYMIAMEKKKITRA